MDDLSATLDAAQWKEIVAVEADHHEAVNLVASLDMQNGGLEWNRIPNDQVVARHLDAKQWILPMLNDRRRNQLYYDALRQALDQLSSSRREQRHTASVLSSSSSQPKEKSRPIRVLDLGCGTGLLGLMATSLCTSENDPVHVTAVDMSPVMTHLARHTIQDNNDNKNSRNTSVSQAICTVMDGHSTQLPPLRAHLCVSELLEDGLLGEGWLPAVRDAWQRHMVLSSPAVMIPARATVYAQLVQGEWLRDYTGPHPYTCRSTTTTTDDAVIHFIPPHRLDDTTDTTGTVPAKTVVPTHITHLIEQGHLVPVSDPVQLFDFDVTQADGIPPPEGRRMERTVVTSATASGAIHAVLVWWSLQLGRNTPEYHVYIPHNRNTTISQDHWRPCLHVLESALSIDEEKQSWTLQARHDDFRIQVSLAKSHVSTSTEHVVPPPKREKRDDSQGHAEATRLSPGRIFQLNQSSWIHVLERGIRNILHSVRDKGPCLVLDVSDFCVGALLAAKLLANAEQTTPILSLERIQAVEAARAVQASGFAGRVSIWQGHLEQITNETLLSVLLEAGNSSESSTKHLVIVAEPSHPQLHYWPHLEAFQLFYSIQGLRQRLASVHWDIRVVPGQARIWAAALEAPELSQAYGPCDASLQSDFGLDHSYVQEHFGASGLRELSLSLWQYRYCLLTEPLLLSVLSYSESDGATATETHSPTVNTRFCQAGTCHGVVVWVTYDGDSTSQDHNMRPEPLEREFGNHPSVLGTRQLVYIWQHPVDVKSLAQSPSLWGKVQVDSQPIFQFGVTDT